MNPTPAVPNRPRSRRVHRAWLPGFFAILTLALCAFPPLNGADAPSGTGRPARIFKVLPHFLDKQGRHAINPSLFDRDAYQFELRRNPQLRSGMRFDVLWRNPRGNAADLEFRLELRGSKAPELAPVVLKAPARARAGYSDWTGLPVVGSDYEALGDLLAWRVTLWAGETLLAEQKSFLW